ncbi:hypothetical protein SDC9_34465 [bioreactor metagenome]|uniref:Uncharacterized protein n=1 Tax=bioreactor metagenome TaxID=1076179 RepID=A0A644VCL4_9ZZZZ
MPQPCHHLGIGDGSAAETEHRQHRNRQRAPHSALRAIAGEEHLDRAVDRALDMARAAAFGDAEDHPRMDVGLAQLDELIGGKVEILDRKFAALDRAFQVGHQPVAQQQRPGLIELGAKLRKAIALGDADPEEAEAEIRGHELDDPAAGKAQHIARRRAAGQQLARLVGLARAFALRHLEKEQLLVGEIAVERGLRHPRLARDVIDRGALEAVAQKHLARALKNLVELAPLADRRFRLCLRHHAPCPRRAGSPA